MTMTKAEIKAEWIRRLRSGQYKQCKWLLCRDDGLHCVLGVLAELAAEQGVVEKDAVHGGKTVHGGKDEGCDWGDLTYFANDMGLLPDEVREWAGLIKASGWCCHGGKQTSLILLNDEEGKTFAQLADIIESHPKGLFDWEEDEAHGQSN